MSLDIPAIQKTLAIENVDGWLLYDFHGSNPIAVKLAGLAGRHTTRRWYYFIPAIGHAEEARARDRAVRARRRCPATKTDLRRPAAARAGRDRSAARLQGRRDGVLARVRDPVPLARRRGHGRFHPAASACASSRRAIWSAASKRPGTTAAIATHRAASERLYRDQGPGVRLRRREALGRRPVTEFEVQQADGARGSTEEGLVADAAPIVAAQENAGNPHYAPIAEASRPIRPNELVLLDLWGKLPTAGRGLRRHHLGRVRGRPAGRDRQGLRRHRRRPRRGGREGAGGGRRRPADARLGGRSRGARRHHRGRLRRSVHPPHRAQPGRGSARQRRAHGRLRNARRPAAASPARASRSSRGSTRRRSACGRRSTWWSARASAEVTGPAPADAGADSPRGANADSGIGDVS